MPALKSLQKRLLGAFLPRSLKRYLRSRSVGKHQELTSGEMEFFQRVKHTISTVVDVGARTDTYYSEIMEDASYPCSTFMFEANPVFAGHLKKKVKDFKQVNLVFDKAVGSEVGPLFYYYDTQSFFAGSKVGTVSKLKSRKPISVTTLDLHFKNQGGVDFLKTDIEEMDFHALWGAQNLLKNVKYLQFELGIGSEFGNQVVSNENYWDLLEDRFHLFVLKDSNPFWHRWPNLPLLLCLDAETKLMIEVLQATGAGFNIIGVQKGISIDELFKDEYVSIRDVKKTDI